MNWWSLFQLRESIHGSSVTQQIFANKIEGINGKESQMQENKMQDEKNVNKVKDELATENFASSNETLNEVEKTGKNCWRYYQDAKIYCSRKTKQKLEKLNWYKKRIWLEQWFPTTAPGTTSAHPKFETHNMLC